MKAILGPAGRALRARLAGNNSPCKLFLCTLEQNQRDELLFISVTIMLFALIVKARQSVYQLCQLERNVDEAALHPLQQDRTVEDGGDPLQRYNLLQRD